MARYVPPEGRLDARIVKVKAADLLRFIHFLSPQPDGCWCWRGKVDRKGYSQFWSSDRTYQAMHFALSIAGREIPKGLEPDHLCRNRQCVNPDHLEVVTRQENLIRGNSPVGYNARKLRCIRGHLFTESNTRVIRSHGYVQRICKQCDLLRSKRYYAKVRTSSR